MTIFQEDLLKHKRPVSRLSPHHVIAKKIYDVVILDPISGLRCNRSIQRADEYIVRARARAHTCNARIFLNPKFFFIFANANRKNVVVALRVSRTLHTPVTTYNIDAM